MMTFIFVLCGILVAFVMLWAVFSKKRFSHDKPDVLYTCSQCGEKHCNCYREDDKT